MALILDYVYTHTFKLRSLWFCALCLSFIANASIGNVLDSELWDVKNLLNSFRPIHF